ncbi:MAG TPA: hypothetical protein VFM75_05545, partial [Modicisalibacter sp.]|nr:hypothetical protein [Modicisalibacter sp.]
MSRLSVDPTRCARQPGLLMLGSEAMIAQPSPQPPRKPAYRWHDDVWLRQREREGLTVSPLSIYRLYPAAWRRDDQGAPLGWEALIEQLVPYVADLGFTHIELAQISDAAVDGSFCGFIDACHEGGIGVILKWPVEPDEEGVQEDANDPRADSALG